MPTGHPSPIGAHMTWAEICDSAEYRGKWVALDNCRYDQHTSQPIEGDVVDSDEDLAELCGRIRASELTSCAILFCDDDPRAEPISRRTPPTPRALHH